MEKATGEDSVKTVAITGITEAHVEMSQKTVSGWIVCWCVFWVILNGLSELLRHSGIPYKGGFMEFAPLASIFISVLMATGYVFISFERKLGFYLVCGLLACGAVSSLGVVALPVITGEYDNHLAVFCLILCVLFLVNFGIIWHLARQRWDLSR